MMEKPLRCTVCTWRGPWSEALENVHVQPIEVAESESRIQAAYEEKNRESAQYGVAAPPHCPACGHHTVFAKRHSIRPAM